MACMEGPETDRCGVMSKGRCSREHLAPQEISSASRACVRSRRPGPLYVHDGLLAHYLILLLEARRQTRIGFVGFRPVLHEVPVLGDALEGILLLDRVCSVGEALWFLGIWSQEVLPELVCAIPSTTRGHPEPRYAPRPVQAETRECRREMSRRGSALGRWCAPT